MAQDNDRCGSGPSIGVRRSYTEQFERVCREPDALQAFCLARARQVQDRKRKAFGLPRINGGKRHPVKTLETIGSIIWLKPLILQVGMVGSCEPSTFGL